MIAKAAGDAGAGTAAMMRRQGFHVLRSRAIRRPPASLARRCGRAAWEARHFQAGAHAGTRMCNHRTAIPNMSLCPCRTPATRLPREHEACPPVETGRRSERITLPPHLLIMTPEMASACPRLPLVPTRRLPQRRAGGDARRRGRVFRSAGNGSAAACQGTATALQMPLHCPSASALQRTAPEDKARAAGRAQGDVPAEASLMTDERHFASALGQPSNSSLHPPARRSAPRRLALAAGAVGGCDRVSAPTSAGIQSDRA